MRNAMSLLLKFITAFIASWVAFDLIDENPMNMIFTAALAGAVINFLCGDFLVLPSMGKTAASIVYGILAAVTAYLIDLFSYNFSTSATSLIIFAAIIAASEYFFHIYLFRDEVVSANEFHKEPPME